MFLTGCRTVLADRAWVSGNSFTGADSISSFEELADGAKQWLHAGESELAANRIHVAFEAFRQAAELAAKVILARANGAFPQTHLVAGPLKQAGLLPEGVEASKLHRLVSEFTLGTYGFNRPLSRADVQAAARIARRMIAALKN